MICPKCNGETKVCDSRKIQGNSIRRRVCLVCKYRFSTKEEILPETRKEDIMPDVNTSEYIAWLLRNRKRLYRKERQNNG